MKKQFTLMIIVETTNSCMIFQVPPAELEALLLTHPEIDDAAVIPYVSMSLSISMYRRLKLV